MNKLRAFWGQTSEERDGRFVRTQARAARAESGDPDSRETLPLRNGISSYVRFIFFIIGRQLHDNVGKECCGVTQKQCDCLGYESGEKKSYATALITTPNAPR